MGWFTAGMGGSSGGGGGGGGPFPPGTIVGGFEFDATDMDASAPGARTIGAGGDMSPLTITPPTKVLGTFSAVDIESTVAANPLTLNASGAAGGVQIGGAIKLTLNNSQATLTGSSLFLDVAKGIDTSAAGQMTFGNINATQMFIGCQLIASNGGGGGGPAAPAIAFIGSNDMGFYKNGVRDLVMQESFGGNLIELKSTGAFLPTAVFFGADTRLQRTAAHTLTLDDGAAGSVTLNVGVVNNTNRLDLTDGNFQTTGNRSTLTCDKIFGAHNNQLQLQIAGSELDLHGGVNFDVGAALAVVGNAIAPTSPIHHVGAGLIKNITVPGTVNFGFVLQVIPDVAFTYDATGNIVVPPGGGLATVNKLMTFVWDGAKWTPSY